MSDSGHQTPSTIKISKTHDLRNLPRETGTYQREVEDGIVHTFTIKDGKVVKHEAVDREGRPLATSRIRIEAAWGSGAPVYDPDTRTCYFCTSGGDTWGAGGDGSHQCWEGDCVVM
jgi:hypothetical protein